MGNRDEFLSKLFKRISIKPNRIINDDFLMSCINKCTYIKKCAEDKKNNKKDINSLCYLIRKNLTQSECIRLGIAYEKWLCDVIIDNSSLINIKNKNKKRIRERDHLFICHDRKKVYYAELKANLNLDTEKSKSTMGLHDHNFLLYNMSLRHYCDSP